MKACPYCAEEIQDEAIKCKHCGTWLSPPGEPPPGPVPPGVPYPGPSEAPPRRLARSAGDRMLAGVCGGLARYLQMDATITRVLFALATVFSGIVPGIVVYLVLAAVLPTDATATP